MVVRRALIFGLLIVAIAGLVLRSTRLRATKLDKFEREEREAGLDRRVRELNLGGLSARQAIAAIKQQTGVRIAPDWASLARAGVFPDSYGIREIHVHDESVAQVLCRLLGMYGGYEVRNGQIILKNNRELPRLPASTMCATFCQIPRRPIRGMECGW